MGTLETLMDDMKTAMKSGDKTRLSTIRQLRSQLKDAQIAKGDDLEEPEIVAVLNNAAKRRREAIKLYEEGGREELAAAEAAELEVIQSYLPQQLDDAELAALVDAAVSASGAGGMGDFGKVMGQVMAQARGRADGKRVQQLVREKLQG